MRKTLVLTTKDQTIGHQNAGLIICGHHKTLMINLFIHPAKLQPITFSLFNFYSYSIILMPLHKGSFLVRLLFRIKSTKWLLFPYPFEIFLHFRNTSDIIPQFILSASFHFASPNILFPSLSTQKHLPVRRSPLHCFGENFPSISQEGFQNFQVAVAAALVVAQSWSVSFVQFVPSHVNPGWQSRCTSQGALSVNFFCLSFRNSFISRSTPHTYRPLLGRILGRFHWSWRSPWRTCRRGKCPQIPMSSTGVWPPPDWQTDTIKTTAEGESLRSTERYLEITYGNDKQRHFILW